MTKHFVIFVATSKFNIRTRFFYFSWPLRSQNGPNLYKTGMHQPAPDFLELFQCGYLYVFVCICVCLPPRLLITSGVMWHDMDSIWLVNQALWLLCGSCSLIDDKRGLIFELHHINQPNESKLPLYKPLPSL